ncbi:MAG: ubiquitin-like domain-containing protein [Candidatus Helarchaeota archaeon]
MNIKIVSAIGGDVLDLDMSPNVLVKNLKDEISRQKDIPVNIFVLAFRGVELDETQTLQDAGIQANDRIYVITRTEGGFLQLAF